jgi:hypothetical protein
MYGCVCGQRVDHSSLYMGQSAQTLTVCLYSVVLLGGGYQLPNDSHSHDGKILRKTLTRRTTRKPNWAFNGWTLSDKAPALRDFFRPAAALEAVAFCL